MKRFVSVIFLCIILLSSCSNKKTQEYRQDVSIDDISNEVLSIVDSSSMTEADESWISLNLPFNTSLCQDYSVYISLAGSADIVGLFKTDSEENASTILSQCNNYLSSLEKNWLSEYSPEELPKIQTAVSKKCGNYVYFLVLDETEIQSAEKAIEQLITLN